MAYSKEWWYTDPNGLRIGYMQPVDFDSILAGYYGERKWVAAFSKDFNLSLPTLYRYRDGTAPIPKHVAMIVMMLVEIGGPDKLPTIDADWLPTDPSIPEDYKTTVAKKDAAA